MVRRTGTRHTGLAEIGCAIALLALGAGGDAVAAKISEVRVGTHEKQHTRIVLELDAFTGYRLVAPQPGARPELVVNLEASSAQRDVPSKSPLVRKVHVEPSASGGSVVRVQLATADVAVKEMLLSNPPRLVFDLMSRGPLPKPGADELAQEKSEPAEPVAVAAADVEPTPVPAPAKVEEPKAPAPIEVAAATPAAVEPAHEAPLADPIEPAPALEPAAESTPPPAPAPSVAEPIAPPPPPMPAAARDDAQERRHAIAAKAQTDPNSDAGLLGTLLSPIGMAIAGGLVLLVGVVTVMRRRRAADNEDALYTVMSAEDASASAAYAPAYAAYDVEETAVIDAPSPASATPSSDWDRDAFEASEPAFKYATGPRQLALGAQPDVAPEPEASVEPEPLLAAGDSDSIFGNDPVSEPSQAEILTAPIPVSIAAPPALAVAAVSSEMERRLGELERRLEQLTEARERLERQVAAQTEELRVQRAAIARTQRVVRSIAKTEDIATEPVPRAPSA